MGGSFYMPPEMWGDWFHQFTGMARDREGKVGDYKVEHVGGLNYRLVYEDGDTYDYQCDGFRFYSEGWSSESISPEPLE